MKWISTVGRSVIAMICGLGRSLDLLIRILAHSFEIIRRPRELNRQIVNVGVLSLLIISVSGLFVGMVLALQGYYILSRFSADSMLGVLVDTSLVRELSPVVAALLFSGRAGSALTAEIGLMKATEQLAALEMMAVNPISRVLTPRFYAGVISMPVLCVVFSAVGILGGYMIAVGLLQGDVGIFWSQIQSKVDFWHDVVNGIIKSVVFGIVCTWIALYQGYDSTPTSEGISRSTTRTVVHSALAVLGLDFMLTALMFGES